MNTAESTRAVATSAVTSRMACRVASMGVRPRKYCARRFDDDDRVVTYDADREHQTEEREGVDRKAQRCMTANVPISETGTAASGMIDARHVWRKRITTSTTRWIASSSVWTTFSDGIADEDRGIVDDV